MRTFGTAMLGGFLGSMLFSGLANAGMGGGFGGSGFGMIEILLVAGIAFFLYRMYRNRMAASANGPMQYKARIIGRHWTPAIKLPTACRRRNRCRKIMSTTVRLP